MIYYEVILLNVKQKAQASRLAARRMATIDDAKRRAALLRAATLLAGHSDTLLAANEKDMARAKAENLAMPLLKRLRFDEKKLAEACDGLRALSMLPDPLGHTQLSTELTPGLDLYRVSCPIGVIGVVFESRPDALVQIAGLCIRSGNAVLLKGGREALETNRALFALMDQAARSEGLPSGWGALLETREDVGEMLSLDEDIDLIIPRGSNEFVRYIMDHSRIPVLGHADGICHAYVDRDADIPMAVKVVLDSKMQYVAVCNAVETLLVHRDIAPEALPPIAAALREAGTTLRGDARTQGIIDVEPATDADWDTEYLDAMLSIRVVDDLQAAIDHINAHGSGHTDTIITSNAASAREFMAQVDSAGVYWNCSTRFADGFRYGFGAEVGVSTSKLHARGPMGIEGLCTYKYKLYGTGQAVGDGIEYIHRPLGKSSPFDGGTVE
ncbi:glutamate-5-semialdehyde dehydrogenase [Eubacteriales bacterium OttesenSCG-928-A19]|nr:glutamate-5-semialdehyde dehydrogenase [Eubacteriales bacterium OttesenSCG-928-A19]